MSRTCVSSLPCVDYSTGSIGSRCWALGSGELVVHERHSSLSSYVCHAVVTLVCHPLVVQLTVLSELKLTKSMIWLGGCACVYARGVWCVVGKRVCVEKACCRLAISLSNEGGMSQFFGGMLY